MIRTFAVLVVLSSMVWTASNARSASPLLLGDHLPVSSTTFRVTVFASGLDFPMGLVAMPDGSLLVGTSVPVYGGYFGSTGEILRLTDADGDGVADDEGTVLARDLPGTIVAVARGGALLFVTSAEGGRERISMLRRDGSWSDELTLAGSIDFHFNQFDHQTYSLAVRHSDDAVRHYELFFNVGASGNDSSGRIVETTGLVESALEDASIYRVTVEDTGSEPIVSTPELVATGLRNAAAIAFAPDTGDLLIADNGIDTPSDRIVALSADEIDRIPAAAIGDAVEDFGFPNTYVNYHSGETVGGEGIAPDVAFVPITGSENEGAASLAIAPPDFPPGLNQGVFVGFHGQWDDFGIANEENPVLYADPATGEALALIANDDPYLGHPDSLMATETTLYVADLCGGPDGSLAGTVPCGVIYAISPTN